MNTESIDKNAVFRLYRVVGDDLNELEELRQDYLADAPEFVSKICSSFKEGESEVMRIAAHSLKSNARDLGAVRLAEIAAEVELACQKGQLHNMNDLLIKLKSAEEKSSSDLASLNLNQLINEFEGQ